MESDSHLCSTGAGWWKFRRPLPWACSTQTKVYATSGTGFSREGQVFDLPWDFKHGRYRSGSLSFNETVCDPPRSKMTFSASLQMLLSICEPIC
jgi:hypothetical protein